MFIECVHVHDHIIIIRSTVILGSNNVGFLETESLNIQVLIPFLLLMNNFEWREKKNVAEHSKKFQCSLCLACIYSSGLTLFYLFSGGPFLPDSRLVLSPSLHHCYRLENSRFSCETSSSWRSDWHQVSTSQEQVYVLS